MLNGDLVAGSVVHSGYMLTLDNIVAANPETGEFKLKDTEWLDTIAFSNPAQYVIYFCSDTTLLFKATLNSYFSSRMAKGLTFSHFLTDANRQASYKLTTTPVVNPDGTVVEDATTDQEAQGMKRMYQILQKAGKISSHIDFDFHFSLEETDENVLSILSNKGDFSTGTMYKANETYRPPHCYLGKEIRLANRRQLTIYHMGFGANIKGSDVFDMLSLGFENTEPMSFSQLSAGDSFCVGQFQAHVSYTPTWPEKVMIGTSAKSGTITVVGTEKADDKSYLTLKLTNLLFDAIDKSCVYSVSGTVKFEIWGVSDTQ